MLLSDKVFKYLQSVENKKNRKVILNLKRSSLIGSLTDEWVDVMANLGLYNKLGNTFSLNNVEVTEYGFQGDIFIVNGLCFSDLHEKIEKIQSNLGCMITLNHSKNSQWINFKMIYKVRRDKKYKLVEQKNAFELYIGNDYSGNPILVDLKSYPHALITGGTRSGKSVLCDVMLTNLICNVSPDDVSLYLCQIAKDDLSLYEHCKHTRAYADTLEKVLEVLEYIVKTILPLRSKLIKPYRQKALANNYHDYNKLAGVNKLETIYVVYDEMSSLYDKKGGNAESKRLKTEIAYYIDEIARLGAGLGVFNLCSLQRPTADNLSTMVKAQSTVSISFRQNNSKSSEVATDDANLALGLKQREFVFKDNEWHFAVVPLVDHKELYKLLKPHMKVGHRNLFDDLNKLRGITNASKNKEKIEDVKVNKDDNKLINVPQQQQITRGKVKIS